MRLIDGADTRERARVGRAGPDFLSDVPEAASSTVCDYHVDCNTLDGLAQRGAEAPLLSALRQVVGMRQDVEFNWETARYAAVWRPELTNFFQGG